MADERRIVYSKSGGWMDGWMDEDEYGRQEDETVTDGRTGLMFIRVRVRASVRNTTVDKLKEHIKVVLKIPLSFLFPWAKINKTNTGVPRGEFREFSCAPPDQQQERKEGRVNPGCVRQHAPAVGGSGSAGR